MVCIARDFDISSFVYNLAAAFDGWFTIYNLSNSLSQSVKLETHCMNESFVRFSGVDIALFATRQKLNWKN